MRLNSKTDYGLRALVDLTLHERGLPVQSHDIATRQGIPESYLNQLLILLRRAGLIRSVRGPQGGHQLARPAHAISIADVVNALDGPAMPETSGRSQGDAPRGSDAVTDLVVRAAWERVNAAVTEVLSGITLAMLVQERQQYDPAAMFQI